MPAIWRSAIPARLEVIDGRTSWASTDRRISTARAVLHGPRGELLFTLAHEFGHLIAFDYGTQEYLGAPPQGWPERTSRPDEAWADCVGQVLTGHPGSPHGLTPCEGESLSFARSWLESGPSAHQRTR